MKPHLPSLLALSALAAPLFAHDHEEQKLLASDGAAGDSFGRAVAIDDETVLVGAPEHAGIGAAYVFVHDELTEMWVEEAKLEPSDGGLGDSFGISVAISGDLAIVGAQNHDANGSNSGAAYVFLRTGSSWAQQAKLTPTVALAGDNFGASVGIDGTTAVVGAPRIEAVLPTTGSVHAFVQSGSTWSQQGELSATVGVPNNHFGIAVAIVLDTVATGARLDNGAAGSSGAAYIHRRVGTVWSQNAKLIDATGNAFDYFGNSIDLGDDETLVVIGATGDDDGGSASGSMFTFIEFGGVGGTWTQTKKRIGANAGELLGSSVAHAARTSMAGSRKDNFGAVNAGTAKVIINFGSQQTGTAYAASDPGPGDSLGTSVANTSCWYVSGAPGHDALALDAGAVYAFTVHAAHELENGSGFNPECMSTTEAPVIGGHWHIEVDATAYPTAGSSVVVVRERKLATPMMIAAGELILDLSSRQVLATSMVAGGGIMMHEYEIPNDPYVNGYTMYVQSAIRDSGPGMPILTLCNAESIRVGCHHEEEE